MGQQRQWEYMTETYTTRQLETIYPQNLQRYGTAGWELVALIPLQTSQMLSGTTTNVLATFKREREASQGYAPPRARATG